MTQFFEKLFKGSQTDFYAILKDHLLNEKPMFLVTANPEIFMKSETDNAIAGLLADDATTIIADGYGIVKASEMLGFPIAGRIPGVEVAETLFDMGNTHQKSIFLLGAKEEVMNALCKILTDRYPNLTVCGAVNGYVQDKDAVFDEIKKLQPDIVLVGLGVPAQEKLIYKHLKDFRKGIFVGVGGSFDVLSETKRRAPKFFIDHNIEWLYRIAKEPSRIKRFYESNIKFIFAVQRKKSRKQ